MKFSWKSFCEKNGVSFIESGPSTSSGNIYIQCPWCRDGKKYMGLSLTSRAWGCWKDEYHRGKSPAKLIRAILGCSWEQALQHAGNDSKSRSEVLEMMRDLNSLDRMEEPEKRLLWVPSELFPLWTREKKAKKFLDYLEARGFDNPHLVASCYQLHAALVGDFQHRLCFPIFDEGVIVGWTGRAISDRANVRYWSKPSLGGLIWNHGPWIGETLVICEGPFDALKVDWYGQSEGIRAVALLGQNLTFGKRRRIGKMARNFVRTTICLDQGCESRALKIAENLAWSGIKVVSPPAKDPGDLKKDEVLEIFS